MNSSLRTRNVPHYSTRARVCTTAFAYRSCFSMSAQRRAEIVGAGFAGLAAACALAQRGWRVRVHERAPVLRTAGAGIYIYENGLRVLEALGAHTDAVAAAHTAPPREVRDDRTNVLSMHRWDISRSRVYSIVRQTVINALAA